jgi:hypothetical protein
MRAAVSNAASLHCLRGASRFLLPILAPPSTTNRLSAGGSHSGELSLGDSFFRDRCGFE